MQLANNSVVPPDTLQSDLTFWTESAVRDRLTAFYVGKFADTGIASQASRSHWTIWRSYFNDLVIQGRASRQALTKLLGENGLPASLIEEGDNIVIDEIADLILHRFRRAPLQAKAYAKCLVVAATRMGQARCAHQ
jgi:hypothetical protein